MKAFMRTKTPTTQMVECEVSEDIIRRTPFDSEYYTLVQEVGDQEAAYDMAEELQDETGHMHIAKGGKIFRTLNAKTINL